MQVDPRFVPRRRHSRVLMAVLVAVLFAFIYAYTVLAYSLSFDEGFTEPQPAADDVAVVFAPVEFQPDKQVLTADVLLFPGAELVDGDGRLKQSVVVSAVEELGPSHQEASTPSLLAGELLYREGTIPGPEAIDVAALGRIAAYPFDKYDVRLRISVSTVTGLNETRTPAGSGTLPLAATVSFTNAPGWTDTDVSVRSDGIGKSVSFTFVRSGPTIIIVLILVLLMASFGVLAVLVAVASLRGRLTVAMVNATWLTAALFALITLRDRMPGHPPLGAWIDILVYFWVIAAIMLAVVLTLSLLLSKEASSAWSSGSSSGKGNTSGSG